MNARIYFDWNASAPLRAEARDAVIRALAQAGNASSVHGEGRAARAAVERARAQVAQLLGTASQNVVFTSGATEANMLALTPAIETAGEKRKRDKLLVSATEHPSVLCGGRFAAEAVDTLPVFPNGLVDLDALRRALAQAARPLVSVMLANNETGVVQPMAEIAAIVHAAGGLLHVDAAQGPGRIPCDMGALGIDLMTVSSHKIGGPQGAGALVRRSDIHITEPLVKGGAQERGYRGGTENVAAIAGFGAAAAAVRQVDAAQMARLRDRIEAGLRRITPEVVIFGAGAPRLPNTTLFTVPGLKAETTVIAFDLDGVAVSSGAACSSGKVTASHVLAAMGMPPELSRGAIRVSIGWSSTEAEIERFLGTWNNLAGSLLKRRGIAA
ncbi:MAG TPA: cysteine desulfurase family protein [Pseudolabrys sp.]|nr:cysteine desulfurase family protein [Pseudolabrys sp.]